MDVGAIISWLEIESFSGINICLYLFVQVLMCTFMYSIKKKKSI